MPSTHKGPFVLRFKTTDSYYRQFNGQFVRVTFSGGPGTNDLAEAKLFYKTSSAKNASYSGFCELVPVVVSLVGDTE